MRIESSQEMFRHVESGGNLSLDSQGRLETQGAFGRFFQKIGDAFRSLTESGRATIVARNEALYSAMAEVVRQESLVNPSQTDIPTPVVEQARRNECIMRLSVAQAALQLPGEVRAAARNLALIEMRDKGLLAQGTPETIAAEAQAIMRRFQADPVVFNGLRFEYSRTHAELTPLLDEVAQDIRQTFMKQKDGFISSDSMHSSYLKDIERGNVRSINGHPPDASDYEGEFIRLVPDPKMRAFLSMVASQAGLDGALCTQLQDPQRAKDNALFPGYLEMLGKQLMLDFAHHKYDITVEGNEARIKLEMGSVLTHMESHSALARAHYDMEMVVDLSQNMTGKDVPEFSLVNARRTPLPLDGPGLGS